MDQSAYGKIGSCGSFQEAINEVENLLYILAISSLSDMYVVHMLSWTMASLLICLVIS